MSRPRRTVQQEFFDLFADWPVDDQKAALLIIQEISRQKERAERKQGVLSEAQAAADV